MRTVLALLLVAPAAAAQIPELHWARSPGSGQWYGFTPTPTTWHDGEALGVAHGGHLATIRDAAENAWFDGVLDTLDAGTTWIGLNDIAVEGAFVWSSGLPVTYVAWFTSQPGAFSPEHDAAVAQGFYWFDAPPSFGGNRPAIEIGSLPTEGWKLPAAYDLPFLNPGWPDIGDVDGDGRIDVVVPSREFFGATSFAVLRALPGGGFAPAQSFGDVTNIGRVAVADFDADGHDDVAFSARATNTVRVHFAGPAADFAQVWSSPIATTAFDGDVGAGDLDGDGRVDLLVGWGSGAAGRLSVFRADAAGGFHAPLEIALPNTPREITVGDLDGDGDLDWVVTLVFSQMTVCLNDGTGAPSSTTTMPAHFAGQAAEIADFDGDSRVDLAMTSSASGSVRLLWGDGAGGFDANGPVVMQLSDSAGGVSVADFDGDGRPDLCAAGGVVKVERARGAGTFSLATSLFGGSVPRGPRTADLDGDGRPEIVWVANAAPGHPFARVLTVRRFATDCDADGVDDTTEIAFDAALDADSDGALDACEAAGASFCAGDGAATACPCANASAPGAGEGCLHSLGTGGRLDALGTPSLAADDVRLLGSRMTNSSALYFQGTLEIAGGAGAVFGDGLRCAGGATVRIATRTNANGASRYPEAGDAPLATRGGVVAPGMRTYQVWFRNAAAFCTASTFNLTGGVRVDWAP